MSVPLDRLYHYLDDCVNHNLLIYGWAPHGSTNLDDFGVLMDTVTPKDWAALRAVSTAQEFKSIVSYNDRAVMICHDQEPLNVDRYSFDDFKNQIKKNHLNFEKNFNIEKIACDEIVEYCARLGLRGLATPTNHHDLTILLHSEQRSVHVDQFQQQGYVPVYYWSHGIIAQDWFRYAEQDPVLKFDPSLITHDFLIYNRAWSGTREYRLCLTEQIVAQGLDQHCKMSFNAHDGQHYCQHQFSNPEFQISIFELEKFFPTNNHSADASADYCNNDYANTGIEIVLETLFDDSRWHLTEKALRPIACGQPFMLVATAGSLQYLQQYGFKTFAGLIDESYDSIQNPRQRLQAVIAEMTRISLLSPLDKLQLFSALNQIAEQNKHYFFNKFFDQLQQEYVNNMCHAITTINQHQTGKHAHAIGKLMQ
jgi:hypothetical protein